MLSPRLLSPRWLSHDNDYTNHSETVLLCNRCACHWIMNSQRILVSNWRTHRKNLMEAPKLHKIMPVRKPCVTVTDVLCNSDIHSQITRCACCYFGPQSIVPTKSTSTELVLSILEVQICNLPRQLNTCSGVAPANQTKERPICKPVREFGVFS